MYFTHFCRKIHCCFTFLVIQRKKDIQRNSTLIRHIISPKLILLLTFLLHWLWILEMLSGALCVLFSDMTLPSLFSSPLFHVLISSSGPHRHEVKVLSACIFYCIHFSCVPFSCCCPKSICTGTLPVLHTRSIFSARLVCRFGRIPS